VSPSDFPDNHLWPGIHRRKKFCPTTYLIFLKSFLNKAPDGVAPRIPSLDGLRAIAVAFVMAAHATTRGTPFLTAHMRLYVGLLASAGVRIFFVLSGFFITSILLRELQSHGKLSLGTFYWRRALRIFPAFYLFLGLVNIEAVRVWFHMIHSPHVLAAAAYVSNYVPTDWSLGHTWSLSVEEQFYLIWPLALIMLGYGRAMLFPILIVLICPLTRAVYVYHGTYDLNLYHFECVADSLAMGCIIARFRDNLINAFHQASFPLRLRIGPGLTGGLSGCNSPFQLHFGQCFAECAVRHDSPECRRRHAGFLHNRQSSPASEYCACRTFGQKQLFALFVAATMGSDPHCGIALAVGSGGLRLRFVHLGGTANFTVARPPGERMTSIRPEIALTRALASLTAYFAVATLPSSCSRSLCSLLPAIWLGRSIRQ
jgi:hypothetical protein